MLEAWTQMTPSTPVWTEFFRGELTEPSPFPSPSNCPTWGGSWSRWCPAWVCHGPCSGGRHCTLPGLWSHCSAWPDWVGRGRRWWWSAPASPPRCRPGNGTLRRQTDWRQRWELKTVPTLLILSCEVHTARGREGDRHMGCCRLVNTWVAVCN